MIVSCIFVLTVFVSAETRVADLKEEVIDVFASGEIDEKLIETINNLDETDRGIFFDTLGEESGIDLGDLKEGGKELDNDGNLVLNDNRKVDLKGIYDYGKKAKEGELSSSSYSFRGEDFGFDKPQVKSVRLEGDSTIYEFENGGTIKLEGDAEFDLEEGVIKYGENKVEWMNRKGSLEVSSGEIKMGVNSEDGVESNLRDFPILKDSEGETVSPFLDPRGVEVDLPEGFTNPGEGNYKTFEKDGKTYAVNSDGGIYELKETSVSVSERGQIEKMSNALLDTESGEVFVPADTYFERGGEPSLDLEENYIWISGDGDSVRLSSPKDEMYFEQKQALTELELNGNVKVKNGNHILSSDGKGNIRIRKIDPSGGELDYTIDKLYTSQKKDDFFILKAYEGGADLPGNMNEEILMGKIMVHNKEGELIFLGTLSIEDMREMGFLKMGGKGSEAGSRAEASRQLRGQGTITEGTVIHEAVHFSSSKLTQQMGLSGYMTPSADGSAAFYLWGEDETLIMPTSGFRKDSVAELIPTGIVNDHMHQNYFYDNGFAARDALHIVEDYNAELHGFEADSPSLLRDMMINSAALGMKMEQSGTSPERMEQYNAGFQYLTERAATKQIDLSGFQASTDAKAVAIKDHLRNTYGSSWTQEHLGYN